ncbi:MAG: ABC transporter ATP-binding protein [Clostridiales Family XIII bacterium]|jgi:oligopeptide/dipeptide ABC transporter ATP-binding protein|nr:ABC transporter ATP-binding protein [Clostridiales Family XIII bacterium]
MPLLSFENLHISLMTANGIVYAVQGIDLRVRSGEILGLVGESGSGKTMAASAVLRLHDEKRTEYHGAIRFGSRDVLAMGSAELRRLRGREVGMIFQDPMSSLNPIMPVGEQIAETIRAKLRVGKGEARARATELLQKVGVVPADRRYRQYPFELSGGMMQRVMIAIALSCSPKLLIADEPTTALDATIQIQVLDLIRTLQKQDGMAVLLVTHDLGVVAEVCDRVAVLYAGRIMEEAPVAEIFDAPLHPYTVALMGSRPQEGVEGTQPIPGMPPALDRVFAGCPFAERCHAVLPVCREAAPAAVRAGGGRTVCCHRVSGQSVDKPGRGGVAMRPQDGVGHDDRRRQDA